MSITTNAPDVNGLDIFYDYKNRLMYDILSNETIRRYLSDNREDIASAEELAYSQVFPFEYIPNATEHGVTYVCFDVELQSAQSKTVMTPSIYIWVFSHRDAIRLPNGEGVRPDAICSEIAKRINGSLFYGTKELELQSIRRYAPMLDYNGKLMLFTTKELNRPYNSGREIPRNRKDW